MAINFPLSLPATARFTRVEMGIRARTGSTESSFSFAEQRQEWNERWEGGWTLPPYQMVAPSPHDRAAWQEMEAFLSACRHGGTFLAGDPLRAALLGAGPAAGNLPEVQTAGLAGAKTLQSRAWGNNRVGALKRGDLFQLSMNYLQQTRAFDNAAWVKLGTGTAAAPTVTANVSGTDDEIAFPSTDASSTSRIGQLVQFSALPGGVAPAGRTVRGRMWLRAASQVTGLILSLVRSADLTGASFAETTITVETFDKQFEIAGTFPATGANGVVLRLLNPQSQAAKTVIAAGANLSVDSLDARLHEVESAADLDADGTGSITADIVPRLRKAVPEFSPLILTNAVGTWRLRPGQVLAASRMPGQLASGLGFEAVEAIIL